MRKRNKFVIATKGICLLCLKDNNQGGRDEKIASSEEELTVDTEEDEELRRRVQMSVPTNQSFMEISRYLEFSFPKVFHGVTVPSDMAAALEYTEMMGPLCLECLTVLEKFGKLYKELERLRLKLNTCVNTISELMQEGNDNLERVNEYRQRMTATNPVELVNVRIIENFRNEILLKCKRKLRLSLPMVKLRKLPEKLSKTNSNQTQMQSQNSLGSEDTSNEGDCRKSLENEEDAKADATEEMCTEEVPEIMEIPVDIFKVEEEEEDLCDDGDQMMDFNFANLDSNSDEDDNQTFDNDPLMMEDEVGVNNQKGDTGGSSYSEIYIAEEQQDTTVLKGKSRNIRCPVCEKLINIRGFRRHSRLHTGERPYRCSLCKEDFIEVGNARKHMLKKHVAELFDDIRQNGYLNRKTAVTKDRLESAVKSIMLDEMEKTKVLKKDKIRTLKCFHCNKSYKCVADVRAHILLVHFNALRAKLHLYLHGTVIPPDIANHSVNSLLYTTKSKTGKTFHVRSPSTFISTIKEDTNISIVGIPKDCNNKLSSVVVDRSNPKTLFLNPSCSQNNVFINAHSHPAPLSQPLKMTFVCKHCASGFASYHEHHAHLLTEHRFEMFSKYFPPGTTSSQANALILSILEEHNGKESRCGYQCGYCLKEHTELAGLQAHILIAHFNDLILKIQRYYAIKDNEPQGEYQLRINESGSRLKIEFNEIEHGDSVNVKENANSSVCASQDVESNEMTSCRTVKVEVEDDENILIVPV